MNAGAHVPRWTRRQWGLGILLFTVVQVGLVFWASESRLEKQHPPPPHAPVLLVRNALGSPEGAQRSGLSDPTLFALVHPRGFSRSAWLTIRPFPYRMTNQPGHPEPLSFASEELVDEFSEFVQTNLLSGDRIGGGLPPGLSTPGLATPVVVHATVLRVEGGLKARPWTADQPLPQEPKAILTNTPTVVRVLVNAAGLPVSAALLSSSGVPEADRDALNYAKGMRFGMTSGGGAADGTRQLQWAAGYVVFQWHSVRWLEPGASTAQAQVSNSP